MLQSRALGLLRRTLPQIARFRKTPNQTQTRRSHDSHHDHHHHNPADGWTYRNKPEPQHQWELAADLLGGFMWWWILFHIYHDYERLIGHTDYPNPSKWTNEELGIPPDDEVYENFNPETCIYPAGFYDKK